MLNLDLHSHSTFSDGTLTPGELVARAAQRGVAVLALTDHDDTGGLEAARAAAAEHHIRLIDGVEISVTWRGQTVHVVGLGIDPSDAALQAGLAATRGGRVDRALKIIAALEALGITGSRDGVQQYASNPRMIGRTHFARFLVAQGVVKDVKTAFKRLLGGGQPCYVPHQWATLGAAVSCTAQMRELLAEFRDLGGAAIEVVSSSHRPHHYAAFAAHARQFGLAASAGSDFHSPQESYHDLGGLPALPSGCVPVWEKFSH
ncbi:MAG: PHP domain-containing protein [Betaproteobacteria bacterium]|nr:PHP domain-containing protein [Betaproteobacteria bacterium]